MRSPETRSSSDTPSAEGHGTGSGGTREPDLGANSAARLARGTGSSRLSGTSLNGFWRRLPRAGRILAAVWAGLITAAIGAGATLAWLGPQPKAVTPSRPSTISGHTPPTRPNARDALNTGPAQGPVPPATPSSVPASVHDHPAPSGPNGPDARRDARSDANPLLIAPSGPFVTLVIDGVGFSDDLTRQALALPSAIGVVISPYLGDAPAIEDAARARGHAVLLSLPMEPVHTAQDDEGPRSLGDTHTPQEDQDALTWALSRLPAPDGVTDAASGMSGGAFVSSSDFVAIARRLEDAHLAFVEAEPKRTLILPGVAADLVIDGDTDAASVDAQLAALADIARHNGHALGMTRALTPVLLTRIATWARSLPGVRLAPITAALGRADPAALPEIAVAAAPVPPPTPVTTPASLPLPTSAP